MASLEEMKILFNNLKTANLDESIHNIKSRLTGKEPKRTDTWDSLIEFGRKFLYCLDEQEKKFGGKAKEDLLGSGYQVSSFIGGFLEFVGDTHWVLAGLSMIGRLLEKKRKMSNNRDDCLQLLQYMFDLVLHIRDLRIKGHQRDGAFVIIVKGCILCAKQLSSGKLFRFLRSSLDKENLQRLRSQIDNLYSKIGLAAAKVIQDRLPERLESTAAIYPDHSAGIRKRVKHVMDMLQIGEEDKPFRAVIIYGFGGIGKSTLARAVIAELDLKAKGYRHTRLDMGPKKKSLTDMQQQILMDLFPEFNGGTPVDLRDPDEGKKRLKRAFEEWNEHIFLFIDDVQRIEDLGELLPKGLESLSKRKHIRFLLTTRNLSETDMFKKCCHTYLLKPLSSSDAEEFLHKQTKNRLRGNRGVKRILEICCGVPLALEIVCSDLVKMGYSTEKISQTLDLLQKGGQITNRDLSKRMVDDVYSTFEGYTKEAFLDICCFFNDMHRRIVEPVVGSLAFKALRDAALITLKLEPEYYAPMQENEEIVVVHDLIRARGKHIAGSTRIRDIQSFEDAVKEQRVEDIKGISLYVSDESSYVLKKEHLISMSKSLRVLILGRNISFGTTSKMKFPELKHVSLSSYITCLPFDFRELNTLAVYDGPIVTQDGHHCKLPPSLRRIMADNTSKLSLPLPVAPNSSLEAFSLTNFTTKTLPINLDQFTELKSLKLYDWGEKELPEEICRLRRLTTLRLGGSRLRNLPRSFGDLECLRHLVLKDCDRLEGLPSSFVELKALRYLNLSGCTSLKRLPSTFGELTDLRGLIMKNCASLKELPGLRYLTGLRYMDIQYCSNLRGNFRNIHGDLEIVR